MSNPSSPAPPTGTNVPYLAYRSKRHSRNLSGSASLLLTPNQSPPPISRPTSIVGPPATLQIPKLQFEDTSDAAVDASQTPDNEPNGAPDDAAPPVESSLPSAMSSSLSPPLSPPLSAPVRTKKVSTSTIASTSSISNGVSYEVQSTSSSSTVAQGASAGPSVPRMPAKKASTFRRMPLRNAQSVQPAHSARNSSEPSPTLKAADKARASEVPIIPSPLAVASPIVPSPVAAPSPPITPRVPENIPLPYSPAPASRQQSLSPAPALTPQPAPAVALSTSRSSGTESSNHEVGPESRRPTPASLARKPAPYRPGFQPKGVYRPLTDEFIAVRRTIRDGEGEGGISKVERTKLERRLEKLIALHFPHPSANGSHEKRPRPRVASEKRRSSFFDLQNLRSLSMQDAGDLWRGVVTGDTSRADVRAMEQRITPWQEDASVTKCPMCSAPFHPLTNRKHHCRLCGQIICSLPIKHPQRPVLCSTLFVVDSVSRHIEEVGEGVDYGVKKRQLGTPGGQQGRQEDEEKFLKGVRICRDCRPILLRQQYYQQASIVPPFIKLYENFINLEAEIEEALPKFQELVMSLNQQDQPTKEASAARKRLLESFAQYDKLSKQIRAIPCSNGSGSSQDRVQAAILTRANLFLQKNMFPLQSLPTPRSNGKSPSSTGDAAPVQQNIDDALAVALQPLLEQESLLESFVEEAQAQRKFEDVKSLKVNLAEIRNEIEKILADGGNR